MSNNSDTALVLTDPQNDFLSDQGVAWELVGRNVQENGTVDNIERLLQSAKSAGTAVFVSPHYYSAVGVRRHPGAEDARDRHVRPPGSAVPGRFPRIRRRLAGPVRPLPHRRRDRRHQPAQGLRSPEQRSRPAAEEASGQQSRPAGMSANLCVESHLRHLLEQGFEVVVAADATAAAQHPDLGDGYAAALTNFRYIANGVVSTEEAAKELAGQG